MLIVTGGCRVVYWWYSDQSKRAATVTSSAVTRRYDTSATAVLVYDTTYGVLNSWKSCTDTDDDGVCIIIRTSYIITKRYHLSSNECCTYSHSHDQSAQFQRFGYSTNTCCRVCVGPVFVLWLRLTAVCGMTACLGDEWLTCGEKNHLFEFCLLRRRNPCDIGCCFRMGVINN